MTLLLIAAALRAGKKGGKKTRDRDRQRQREFGSLWGLTYDVKPTCLQKKEKSHKEPKPI